MSQRRLKPKPIDPALVKLFRTAVAYVATLPAKGPTQLSTKAKLQFYGCFKQATEGALCVRAVT